MLWLLTRAVAFLTAALSLLVGGVRWLPYDHSAIEQVRVAFEPAENCAALCFMGLYPGMPVGEALSTLEKHPWVRSAYLTARGSSQSITWRWNGQQPTFINTLRSGIVYAFDQRITWLVVRTNLTMGDMWLIFGPPEYGIIDPVYNFVDYMNRGFSVRTRTSCTHFWSARSEIYISSWHDDQPPAPTSTYDLSHVRRQVCREM